MKVAVFMHEFDEGEGPRLAVLKPAATDITLETEMGRLFPDTDYITVEESELPDRNSRDKWVIDGDEVVVKG